jgi:CRP-like cAMP-binding protein
MTSSTDINNFARIPLFGVFEPAAINALTLVGEPRTLEAGELLFRRDERTNGGFIVLSGSVALYENDVDDNPLCVLGPWTLIGENALVVAGTRPVTAAAAETATVMAIGRDMFHNVLLRYPRTAARTRDFVLARLGHLARRSAAVLGV